MGVEKLYFIRVGGTAMGGVAAACQALGDQVSGSEEALYEPMKSYLATAGVQIFPTFDPSNVDKADPDRIVVGNAVSRGNTELEVAMEQRRTLVSLPQLISERLISKNRTLVVTGTHGKTKTTAMAAWMFESAGLQPGFLVGGVPGNFDVSCRPSGHHDQEGGLFVIEGDEYDTAFFDKRSKFLWYRPTVAILGNLEHDHADIFEDVEAVKRSFSLFLRLVPRNGLILAGYGERHLEAILKDCDYAPILTFGLDERADWHAKAIEESPSGVSFDAVFKGETICKVSCPVNGEHNVKNLLSVVATAHWFGLSPDAIQQGAATFRLPKRRMEEIGEWQGALVIDDFAHHPTAIVETLKAVRAKYPSRRVFMVFEPRSNTTTRNLYEEEFKAAFEGAAGVFFGALDRPWRYPESERLNTRMLSSQYREKGIAADFVDLEQGKEPDWGKYAKAFLGKSVAAGDVILLGSNGDLGGLRKLLLM